MPKFYLKLGKCASVNPKRHKDHIQIAVATRVWPDLFISKQTLSEHIVHNDKSALIFLNKLQSLPIAKCLSMHYASQHSVSTSYGLKNAGSLFFNLFHHPY